MITIAIRADASVSIGNGHVMRCLTLAKALRDQSINIIFLCAKLPGNLIEWIQQEGFTVIALEHINASLNQALENRSIAWIIKDHYDLNLDWEQEAQTIAPLLVIDDFPHVKHAAQIVLNPSLPQGTNNALLGETYYGAQYALIRPEILPFRKSFTAITKINRILVTLGGSDLQNTTALLAQCLENIVAEIQVVIGNNYAHRDSLNKFPHLKIYQQPKNFPELLANADVVIGAGGSTTWEALYLGKPLLTLWSAENQRELCEQGHAEEILFNLGPHTQPLEELVLKLQILTNFDLLNRLATHGHQLVDGKGVERVVDLLG